MPQATHDSHLVRIEPSHRLVVLARTLNVMDAATEAALKYSAVHWARSGETCLGQALYRHQSVFQNASDVPVWSHFELSYFRDVVPAGVIQALVNQPQPTGTHLLRAEILLTTPSSFILPRDWQGSAGRPDRVASLEFIDVQAQHLGEYRDTMRHYCGPAATKLVQENRFGTFRAMETAAILYRATEMAINWNQIHLCELNPEGFDGFGKAFAAALRANLPNDADLPDAFAHLGQLRTVPRWTFNNPVVEADSALCSTGGIGDVFTPPKPRV